MKKRLMAVLLCICMALSSFAGTGITVSATEETSIVNDDDLTETSDAELAATVDGLIEAIGTVSLESADTIKEARDAYDALTEEQKALVTKLETLTEAEGAYQKLQDDGAVPVTPENGVGYSGVQRSTETDSTDVIYENDFQNDDLSEFKTSGDVWSIQGGKLKASSTGFLMKSIEGLPENYEVSADIAHTGNNKYGAGIVFGAQDSENYYHLRVNYSNKTYKFQLLKFSEGTSDTSIGTKTHDCTECESVTMTVRVEGNKFTCYADNEMLFGETFIATNLGTGVGYRAYNTQMESDKLSVRALSTQEGGEEQPDEGEESEPIEYHLLLTSEGVTKNGFTNESSTYKDSISQNASVYSEDVGDYVQYQPTSMEPGWYKVSFWNIADGQSTMKMTATIYADGREYEVKPDVVTETGWTELGEFYFSGTSDEYLKMKITTAGTWSRLADVKFVKTKDSTAPDISLESIADRQVFQRDVNTKNAQVTVAGMTRNVNSLKVCVVKWDQPETVIQDWVDVTLGNDGSFTKNLTLSQGGWYKVVLKGTDQNNNEVTEESGRFGVGINILCIGQSNMVGIGQGTATQADDRASNFMDETWSHLEDPYDIGDSNTISSDSTKGTSMIPVLANELIDKYDIPVGIIPAAKGGAGLVCDCTSYPRWLDRNENDPDDRTNLYGNSLYRANAAGGVEFILMNQGEHDVSGNTSEADYLNALKTLVNNYRSDMGYKVPFLYCQLGLAKAGTWNEVEKNDVIDGIRSAQLRFNDPANGIIMAAVESDLSRNADNLHYSTESQNILGKRVSNTIFWYYDNAENKTDYYTGPSVTGVEFADDTRKVIDVKISHGGGTDITSTENITGFAVLDGATLVTIDSAKRKDATTITLTLQQAITGTCKVRYLKGCLPDVTGIVKDNSRLQLPLNTTAGWLTVGEEVSDVIYENDFENSEKLNEFGKQSGTWSVAEGKLNGDADKSTSLLIKYLDALPENYEVSADITQTGATDDSSLGIVFGATNDENFYHLRVCIGPNKYGNVKQVQLLKWSNNKATKLIIESPYQWYTEENNKTCTLTAKVVGNKITCYVNDQELFSYTLQEGDPSLGTGVGYRVYYTTMNSNKLTVKNASGLKNLPDSAIIVDNEDDGYKEEGTFNDADNQIKGRDDSGVRLAEDSSAKARWETYAKKTENYTVYYWNPIAQSESCTFSINTMDGMWKKTLGASELSLVGWVEVATISGTETTAMSAEISGVSNKLYADAVAFVPTSDKADEQYNSTGGGSSEVAVLVNQIGYDSGTSMRATVPNANDGTKFQVVNAATGNAVYEGEIKNNIADFTGQISCTDDTDYYITCAGARSYNFTIGENVIYRRSVENALKFMAETRHDEFKWGLSGDKYSIGWRDGHQFSFELNGLVLQYMANPSLYDNMDYQIYEVGKCEYEELRTQDEPAIIWLMQFAALRYYDRGQECKLHALTKEQLAYFLYIYPQISKYVSKDTYEKIRDYTIDVWGDSECTSEGNGSAYSISGTNHDLYSLQTVFGGLKGSQPPGHSIVPNLLMYEVALRDDLGTDVAEKFFKAAYDNCEYLIGDEIDIKDPFYNKGQRMSEYITIPALSYFLEMYPDKAPEDLKEEIQSWAEVTIKRADNMWDTRMAASMEAGDSQYYFHHPGLADTKLSEDYWTGAAYAAADKQTDKTVYPGGAPKNEPGNQAGLQAITYAAARVLDDSNTVDRLQAIGVAAIDDLFGRNPSGRAAFYHFTRDFIGADLGWYTQYSGGVGLLGGHTAVIDANAPEGCYPYNPESYNTGYTEGWVAYNTAWNASIAYAAANAVDLQVSKSSASKGENITITLTAPMNMDSSKAESGEVIVTTSTGEKTVVIVTEDGTNSSVFKGSYTLPDVPYITISYGSGLFENSCEVTVEDFNGVSVTSIHLEDEQLTLGVGEKIRLNAVVLPSNASDQRVSYSTSNANVASVTSDGQVKAIGVGEAVVTVSSVSNPNLTDTCKVTVKAAVPTGLQLKASDTLNAMSDGDEKLAISGVIYSDGSIKTDNLPDTVEFATDNKKVLVVKADGTMIPVGVGTATVTATATVDGKKISGEAEIQVTAIATYNLLELYRAEEYKTTGTATAEEGKNVSDGEFLKLHGNAADNEISFNLGNIDADKYQVTLYTKFGSNTWPYGVWTLKMDGKTLKEDINFTDNGVWKSVDLGEVILTDGNNHTFTFVSEDGGTLVPGTVTLTRIGGENPDLKAAEAVDKLIEAIGTVTKDSGEVIKAARSAYDNLTDVQKLMVEKLDVLTMAEEAYQKLQAGTSKPGTGGESDKEASSTSDKKDSASKDKEDSGTTYVETVYANNTNTGDSAPIIGILLLMSLAIVGIIMIAKRKASKE